MKSLVSIVFLAVIFSWNLVGYSAEEIASKKEISDAMAEVWCLKLAECKKDSGMSPKECRKVLKDSFLRGFNNVAEGQKVQVSKSTLAECSESIKKDTCEKLKIAHSLPGCSFISLLNRY